MKPVVRNVIRFAAVVAVVGWLLLLRPTGLGGPATHVIVSGASMLPTLQDGDFVVTHDRETYQVGDVVAFRVGGKHVIHRIVGGNGATGYELKGDNNPAIDPWRPTDSDIAGESRYVVAGGGRLIGWLRNPFLLACFAGSLALFLTLSRRQSNPDRPTEVPAR